MKNKDISLIKTIITPQMVNGKAFVCLHPFDYNNFAHNTIYNARLTEVINEYQRSNTQLGLYWACCHLVSENSHDENWDTAEKTDEQVKLTLRFISCYLYYKNPKTGEEHLHFKTKSIAFSNLAHIQACRFFDQAFPILAKKLNITVNELIHQTKRKMGGGE